MLARNTNSWLPRVKSEFQNIGDKFQTYVLLEYPIDQANQLLLNK